MFNLFENVKIFKKCNVLYCEEFYFDALLIICSILSLLVFIKDASISSYIPGELTNLEKYYKLSCTIFFYQLNVVTFSYQGKIYLLTCAVLHLAM